MMVIDAQRRVVAMNPTLERWTGQRSDEVVGKSECGVLLACEDTHGCSLPQDAEACFGLQVFRRHQPIPAAEYTILTASGARLPVSASYTPIRPRPGSPVLALVILRDISAQQAREQELERRAMSDPLTGLLNRTALLESLTRELQRASRHQRKLAIALVDVDGLKPYNDTYGHQTGDALLQAVARILQSSHRGSEVVGRYGGDEFLLLLPETGPVEAVVMAERLRRAVAAFPFAVADAQHSAPVTVTIGVAVFPDDGTTAQALIAQADHRLYDGKRGGGNRVIASPGVEERRRERRTALTAPVFLRGLMEDAQTPLHEGEITNLNLHGAYLTIPRWKPIELDEALLLSIRLPPQAQAKFPHPRFAACGCVVRIDQLPPVDQTEPARLGLAVEFIDI
jgi:diguanylate cyclase (GGDEF)-like protein/PAS domain S-box-containing protein